MFNKVIGLYSGRNPFIYVFRNKIVPGYYGHTDLRALQHYSFADDSPIAEVVKTEITVNKLALMYMHIWLLKYHVLNRDELVD
jgi:hypothetical protein